MKLQLQSRIYKNHTVPTPPVLSPRRPGMRKGSKPERPIKFNFQRKETKFVEVKTIENNLDEVSEARDVVEMCTLNDALKKARKRRYRPEYKSFTEAMIIQYSHATQLLNTDAFLYFKRVNTIYELEPLKSKAKLGELEFEYYIISCSGITTQYPNGGATEFTSLGQFEREFFLYSYVKTIPFFKSYRLWKSFKDWKTNVRARKVSSCIENLEENLFILHPLLRNSLLELRAMCCEAARFRLFSISTTSTFELEDFVNSQEKQREQARIHLEAFSDNVRTMLAQACEDALRNFLQENGFVRSKNQQDRQYTSKSGLTVTDMARKEKQDIRAITFTERAAMRTQCRKLTKYIRLIDTLVMDTFLGLVASSTFDFLHHLETRQDAINAMNASSASMQEGESGTQLVPSSKKIKEALLPVFQVKLEAFNMTGGSDDDSENNLKFVPTAETFRNEIEKVIFETLKVVTDPVRLIVHPDFELYAQPAMEETTGGESLDLEMMIVEDPQFQTTIENISECIRLNFENATTYSREFSKFVEKFLENKALMKVLVIPEYQDKEIDVFQELLEVYTSQQTFFDCMPRVTNVGIVQVNSEKLRNSFLPSPRQCLVRIKSLIPDIMRLKANESLKDMTSRNEKLGEIPYSVSDFVDLMAFLRETTSTIEELDARFNFATKMCNLCNYFNIELSEEDNTAIYMLRETNKALHLSIQVIEDSSTENTVRFAKELTELVPKLKDDITGIQGVLLNTMVSDAEADVNEVVAFLKKTRAQVDELDVLRKRYAFYESTLGLPLSRYDQLDEVKQDLNIKSKLWEATDKWRLKSQEWCGMVFESVDPTSISQEVEQYIKVALQAEKALPGNPVAAMLKGHVNDFRRTMPVVTALRCPDLQDRHWETIHAILGYQVCGAQDLRLDTLINLRAMDHGEHLETIAVEAVQEAVLVKMLEKLDTRWDASEFTILQFKESKDHIIGGIDEVIIDLDDSLVTVNTILGSRYVKPIREKVDEWQVKLILFQDSLEEWLTCQKNWMYLESIFSAPDIQRQLPSESKVFFKIDNSLRENMRRTIDDPNCVRSCTRNGLKDTLIRHNAGLDSIQKSLEDYLETKRAAFPRFYFLSNDELLEILAQTKDPQAVQPHLRKCFDALVKLDFGDQPKSINILAMISPEGEHINLGKNLKARGNVEDWLSSVELNMKTSLQKLMKAGLLDYFTRPRGEWVKSHPGQVVATVAQIAWVLGTEAAISNTAQVDSSEESFLDEYYHGAVSSIESWYQRNVEDLNTLTEMVRSNLSNRERKIIVALVTTDVHARDIVETLRDDNVTSVDSFTWQQQLRYYWQKDDLDDCVVRQSNSVIRYAYEYQGCTSRLVIAPLTERCWMTLTGALHLKLGGSPSGPAGTGKTESSKDLAKALGIQCIVYNCSDQIDYKMTAKLFSGLAQAGCWTCLDEFNRIDIEVLSVIAQQLLILRQARLAGLESIPFEGRTILLKDHHVIITMNPGYAGRTELPDNLKVLFRPVAMMVPNYSLIAEIMLFAEGFNDAKNLSRKMAKMYILCSEQLSQQCHYDYGLRAVKSVLVMAGGLKRGNPELSEDVVLIRALRDSNLPKFLSQDVPLFFGILADLFPGVQVPYQDMGDLQGTIEYILEENKLQVVDAFVTKIIQLYETMNVRFGITIVGPTGAGKTTAYQTLADAVSYLNGKAEDSESSPYQLTHRHVLNPKCISMGELYGEFNELSQEWTDGLASSIMRAMVNSETSDSKWIIFDGPIDALWIENMNTVLDDNMTLCLANGERIKLKAEMKCVFEVQDLEVASPATVSRLGVLYMAPAGLGYVPYIVSWITKEMYQHFSEQCSSRFMELVNDMFVPAIELVRREFKEPIETCDIQQASSLCTIFKSFFLATPFFTETYVQYLQVGRKSGETKAGTEIHEKAVRLLDKYFLFALVWSVGASLDATSGEAFDEWTRKSCEKHGLSFIPRRGLISDYIVNTETHEIQAWEELVPKFVFQDTTPFSQIVVPTVDTLRYSFIIEKLLEMRKPCFITGVTGTGKTVIMQFLLQELSKNEDDEETAAQTRLKICPISLGFSAQTSSKVAQLSIEAKLEKKRKTLLGAPAGQVAVIFVDDVNMPQVEEYGAQPPLELLRQFLDFKGFYDRDKLFFKEVQDAILTVAAAPPGGGRNKVTPRFVRHFNVLCMAPATSQTMHTMFNSILSGHLSKGFSQDIKGLSSTIVQSTLDVYFKISTEMLPTPQKSHYTFNLRDLSKVLQGLLMLRPDRCDSVETMTRLWVHESMRVFHDRLVNIRDKTWFKELVIELLKRNFKTHWTLEELFGSDSDDPNSSPLLFADFLRGFGETDDAPYERVRDLGQIRKVLEDALDDYNITNLAKMNLVFFKDAIEHITRISRILHQKRGNVMLVGVGGSGKQSVTRLSMYMSGMKCFQLEITKGYGLAEFREDVKLMMIHAGVEGRGAGFLFTDTQIIDESFLEDINNILNSGEVPNLFPQDEMDRIIADMSPALKEAGIPESRDNAKLFFVNRVRDNMHIVLCMSPVGNNLRVRCRQFPSLINCCTIDWFLQWPTSALNSVANRFLAGLDLPSEQCRSSLVTACAMVHVSIVEASDIFLAELGRTVFTTPKSYLDLIELYIAMLQTKRAEIHQSCDRLSNGVVKLEETNIMVQNLKEELKAMMPVLEEKSKDAGELLKQVAKEQAEASVVKARVAKEEAQVNSKAAEVAVVQEDAQRDLDKALPALNEAIKALDSLDKKDITEIKNFIKPPQAVQTVLEAVNVLLGEKPDWDTAKKVMSDTKFMDNLKAYDKDNISAGTLKKLKKYIEDPVMAVDNVTKVSKAATSLCMWVHAMDVYSVVAKEVGPKRARLESMNKALQEANDTLQGKQAALWEIETKVNELQAKCDHTLKEKNQLAKEAEKTKARLERAEKLTNGLASEGVRWKVTVEQLSQQIGLLVGDIFIAAACISYYGAFTGPYRDNLVSQWRSKILEMEVPCSSGFDLVAVIGNPVTVREWQICGLPTDDVSTNNAILTIHGKRWPLMIDPQMQANRWIKQKEAKNGIECVKMTDPDLLRYLETAVRNGKPLLVEDLAEYIDPALESILQRAVFKQNGRTLVRIGDSDVDFDSNFKLFMTTKLPNPHYVPEVCIKVTLINFTVTMEGLEDQLLGTVVLKERPDIEERKTRLLMSMAADKKQLKDIEDKILKMLAESKGNILDDEELINTLADSKTTSAIITERVQESEKTNSEVTKMRNSYRTAARRGSIIYFVIADLAQFDPMYQYSLEYFVKLFKKCIDDSPKDSKLARRLSNIMDFQNRFIYKNVCRGLFEMHKLLFAFLICVKVMRNDGSISALEWTLFLRGTISLNSENNDPSILLPDGLTFKAFQSAGVLEKSFPESFGGLSQDILSRWDTVWIHWIRSEENISLPQLSNPELKPMTWFQKLIMVQIFREEKVVFAVEEFVQNELGKEFVENTTTSMADIHADMDCKTPCIFVLSQGADPTTILLRFAEKYDYRERLKVISLGQGQGSKAEGLIHTATKTGDWVLLQNCHLAKSWMPRLESLLASFNEPPRPDAPTSDLFIAGNSIHQSFRLFLTSFPASYFPVSILQNGLKLTNEPPKGLKANILRSYETVLRDGILDSCDKKPVEFRKLLFGLCFFHGVVQERRKFGPLGWNIRYEFDDSDLETSTEQLCRFLNEDQIPWDALRYVTGQINYGGRVTDDWDRRCLMSILSRYYNVGILESGYAFSPSGKYFAPPDTDLQGYRDYIDNLPAVENPEVFGMHDNANIAFQLKESSTLISRAISIEPRTIGSDNGSTPDQIVLLMLESMNKRLPAKLDVETEAGSTTFLLDDETGLCQPLATFLGQEIVKFNTLLFRMGSTIEQLVSAICGFVVMSADLDMMYTNMFNDAVPGLWSQVAYPSLKRLSSWFDDLIYRVDFIRSWLQNGLPSVFPLPVFFFPQGFMTSVLQTHARKYQIAINSLGFDFSVYHCEEEDIENFPENGVVVSGLYMEGARWDTQTNLIQDSWPGEMFSKMRPIHFLPVENPVGVPDQYACPVYKTSTRAGVLSTTGMSTNFVLPVMLPTDRDPEYWIWKGVAFLLNLNS